jgi:plastocyanin
MRETLKAFVAAMLLVLLAQAQSSRPVAGRIRIERTATGVARFAPAEIVVWAGDHIHWFNNTGELHEPGVFNKDGVFVPFLEAPLAAQATSGVFSPLARIDKKGNMVAFSIPFVCRRHPHETGTIQVVPTP